MILAVNHYITFAVKTPLKFLRSTSISHEAIQILKNQIEYSESFTDRDTCDPVADARL